MIDFLRGKIVYRETDYVVLDVGGVGYRVFCANPYAFSADGDEPCTLYIHHHVREDAMLLYGFSTREEQTLFRKLLDVSGVGPRVAIGILSAGRTEAIVSAICSEDVAFLTKLPGIGKKTAQRIILDLKDKLGNFVQPGTGPALTADVDRREAGADGAAWSEAKEALVALGYSESEIERVRPAVLQAAEAQASAETLIKRALRELFGN